MRLTLPRPARIALCGLLVAAAGIVGLSGPASAAPAQWTIRPYVNCVWTNADGTRTVSMGYQNMNATTETVAVGTDNRISFGAQGQGQPTAFLSGTHDNAWVLTMSNANYTSGYWYLLSAQMNFTMNGTACTTKPVSAFAGNALVALAGMAVITVAGAWGLNRRRRYGAVTG